jgi:hypothetical protein
MRCKVRVEGMLRTHQIGPPRALPRQVKAGDRSLDYAFDFGIKQARGMRSATVFGYKRRRLGPVAVSSQQPVNIGSADPQARSRRFNFFSSGMRNGGQWPDNRFPHTGNLPQLLWNLVHALRHGLLDEHRRFCPKKSTIQMLKSTN